MCLIIKAMEEELWQKMLTSAPIDEKTTLMRHLFVRNPPSQDEFLDESWPRPRPISLGRGFLLYFHTCSAQNAVLASCIEINTSIDTHSYKWRNINKFFDLYYFCISIHFIDHTTKDIIVQAYGFTRILIHWKRARNSTSNKKHQYWKQMDDSNIWDRWGNNKC